MSSTPASMASRVSAVSAEDGDSSISLMPALDATSIAKREDVAVPVREDLDLDVPCRDEGASTYSRPSPNAASASALAAA